MRNVTYAFLGPEELAAKFGKKGTATDITLYNAKHGDAHLNLVTAPRFPDKIMSLLLALDMADEIVLWPQQLDRSLGETVVAADLLGRTTGFLRVGPQLAIEQIKELLAKTSLRGLTASDEPEPVFRERLFERAKPSAPGGSPVIPVDHSFPVKGVGTVILALVRQGEVKAHQTLQAFPTTKTFDVRSVQVHDVDLPSAGGRSRVGLAVKGAEPDEVGRGKVLAPPGSLKVLPENQAFAADVSLSPFAKWQPRAGAVLHLFHALQDVVARVESFEPVAPLKAKARIKLEGPMAVAPGSAMLLVDVDNKAQRLVGRVEPAPT
ncbi:MAG: hypothetical protein HYT80_11715 [Euryarchaeota archaeon]|nr:hypothetical protein [Euryarchaeota archaeon]